MFEAKLIDGNVLKKIVEAIKDVVNDVNIDVSPSGKFFGWLTIDYRILINAGKNAAAKLQFTHSFCLGMSL